MAKKQILFIVLLLSLGQTFCRFTQNELKFEINKVHPFVSIAENKLADAKTLSDLNKRYPADWMKEYQSVEISTTIHGTKATAISRSDVLTAEQKELLRLADHANEIAVSVKYVPANTLEDNPVKEYSFNMVITPERSAAYAEGEKALHQYLEKNCIAKVEEGSFIGYDLSAVKFTVTGQGKIEDVQVALPSRNPKSDEIFVAAISKMPNWKPAEFSDGSRVRQEFVLTVGNMENCMINQLNIRADQ
jgi:hypothetical protein